MSTQSILNHEKNRIALEEIVRNQAEKEVAKSKKQKIFDKAIPYEKLFLFPNLAAGLVGYAAGGFSTARDAMEQVTFAVLPLSFIAQGVLDVAKRKAPPAHINDVIAKYRTEAKKLILVAENNVYKVAAIIATPLITAGYYAGISIASEKLLKIDVSQPLMAAAGACTALVQVGHVLYKSRELRRKVEENAEKRKEAVEKKKGRRLELEDLEAVARGALYDMKKTNKIFVASSERMLRGAGGALGFFGALDELNDEYRDPTRVKPNLCLRVESTEDRFPARGSLKFNFSYKREKSKTDVALEIARLAYARSNGLQAVIAPQFFEAPLADVLSNPYEKLSMLFIRAEKEEKTHFEVVYSFLGDEDSVDITVSSREHLDMVMELFQYAYGRPLQDTDVDPELAGMSIPAESKPEEPRRVSSGADRLFDVLDKADREREKEKDILSGLQPKEIDLLGWVPRNKEKVDDNQPEQPTVDLNKTARLVEETYRREKGKMLPAYGFPSLSIALPGVVYELTPMEYEQKEKASRSIMAALANPFHAIRSITHRDEILPALREGELVAQLDGISRERIYEITQELEHRIKGLQVDFNISAIPYDTFWEIAQTPSLLASHAVDVEYFGRSGMKMKLSFSTPRQSFQNIRDEQLPSKDAIDARIKEIEYGTDKSNLTKFDRYTERLALLREKEHPSYETVLQKADVPNHSIMYRNDHNRTFIWNSTVQITTKRNPFLETPVQLRTGIRRMTEYLNEVREAVASVDRKQTERK